MDEPTVTNAIITPVDWQAIGTGIAATVLVFCFIFGALLYRVNGLVAAGLEARTQCVEVRK